MPELTRDYGKEIDVLKSEIAEIKALLTGMGTKAADGMGAIVRELHQRGESGCIERKDEPDREAKWEEKGARQAGNVVTRDNPPGPGSIYPMIHMHPDKRLAEKMEELCWLADKSGMTGAVTYMGVFASGGRQSNWIQNEIGTDGLLKLVEERTAEKVLACVGSSDRLNLLLSLLKQPQSVAKLVESGQYSSTGQVYHHLKPLLAANLVKEDDNERGNYYVVPHRVQGIIMILAGIGDLVDGKYSSGSWEGAEQ